ncbi:MAG: hypothetical protein JXB39_14995 [Deltaproteobacteria bacterium]|nr:hypothetical protein [Deltaproteobacteria bacterium]
MRFRTLSIVLGILAPLLTLAAAGLWVLAQREPWAPSTEVLANARAMAAEPDVVVVGHSMAITDLDLPALASLLEDPPPRMARIRRPGTGAPVYYAILRHRVFDAGHRPRLVLVISDLKSLLQTRIPTASGLAPLLEQAETLDEVVSQRTLGASPLRLAFRDGTSRLRTRILDAIKYGAARLVIGDSPEHPVIPATEAALSTVFSAEALGETARPRRVVPVVELDRDAETGSSDPADSYLVDIARMCREHKARLVVVRAPTRPESDEVPQTTRREVARLLNEQGVGWLDFKGAGTDPAFFRDAMHLNAAGQAWFTALLGERLLAIGALGEGPLGKARIPVLPSGWERVGTPPVVEPGPVSDWTTPCGKVMRLPDWAFLSEKGMLDSGLGAVGPLEMRDGDTPLQRRALYVDLVECRGAFQHRDVRMIFTPPEERTKATFVPAITDALPLEVPNLPPVWWVYPGTTLRFTFDEAWPPENDAFSVNVRAAVFGPRADGALAEAAGVQAPLVRLPDDDIGEGDVGAILQGPAPNAPWTLEIRSPVHGPWLALRRLGFGTGDAEYLYVGAEPPDRVPLARRSTTPSGSVLSLPTPSGLRVEDGRGVLDLPGTLVFAEDRTQSILGVTARCSPVVLLEDGVPLAEAHASNVRLAQATAGVYQHVGETLRFRASDGSDPLGHAWTVRLADSRICARYTWILPGDTLVAQAYPGRLNRLRRPLKSLWLRGAPPPQEGPWTLSVTVRTRERSFFEQEIRIADLGELRRFPLDPPVALPPRDLEVEIVSPPDAPPVLLDMILVAEDAPPARD